MFLLINANYKVTESFHHFSGYIMMKVFHHLNIKWIKSQKK